MFGDYISTSVLAGGNAYAVIPVASAPTGSTFPRSHDGADGRDGHQKRRAPGREMDRPGAARPKLHTTAASPLMVQR